MVSDYRTVHNFISAVPFVSLFILQALQDELDAYDRRHKELEEKLDEKTALLIR